MIDKLRKMFLRLDENASGDITIDEIKHMNDLDRLMLGGMVENFDPEELFAALDVHNDGVLSIDEFCAGVWQVSHSQVPLEVKRTEKQVFVMRGQLSDLHSIVKRTEKQVFVMRGQLSDL